MSQYLTFDLLIDWTTLIFDREVARGDMEKTKEKNAVYVGFFIAFGANFEHRPIRFVDLIE